MKRFNMLHYFSITEWCLWGGSVTLILLSFLIFDRSDGLTLTASLLGVTSLIFNAKGNPIGQALMIVFGLLYGIISYRFAYYGEMITYLGMTAPMALFALISWLRHPYRGNRTQVEVNRLSHREILWLIPLTAAVTVLFYFILAYFETQNLIPSTLSVTTSFVAVYLTFRRSPWFAMAYAANDVVLILLWVLASGTDRSFVSVAVCFIVFLVNDLYGFFRWRIMQKQQREPQRGQVHRMD